MKSNLDLVSIIIPVYNAEKFISDAINSALNQTYPKIEVLVADDCSKDKSREAIKSFKNDSRVKIFSNDSNIGAGNTRNKLIKESRGKYIAFLDSDDLIKPDKIEKQIDAFHQNSSLALCGTFCQMTNESLKFIKIEEKNISYSDIKREIEFKNQFIGASIMIKKEVLEEIGGYRDFFSKFYNEDYDLAARIVEKYAAINIPEPLYIYRMNFNSSSQNAWKNPYQFHSHQLVGLFVKQRRMNGTDWLDESNFKAIDDFIKEKHRPYIEDPSLVYREMAAVYNDYDNFWRAIKSSMIGILKRPNKLINYRALGYSMKKVVRII